LYQQVLKQDMGWLDHVVRAKQSHRVPVVLTQDEVKAVLAHLSGTTWIMATLLYGAGLRLLECLRLRVKDVDFTYNHIVVRDGKGRKDRVTMLPQQVKASALAAASPRRPTAAWARCAGGCWSRLSTVCLPLQTPLLQSRAGTVLWLSPL